MANTARNYDFIPPTSFVSIVFLAADSRFIPANQSNYDLDSKIFCFYFPQFEEVFYFQLTKNQQNKESLEKFVRKFLSKEKLSIEGSIDLEKEKLIFSTFDHPEQPITPISKLSWEKCDRVKVTFTKEIANRVIQNKVTLVVKPEISREVVIQADLHKKLHIRQLFIYYELHNYRFNSLFVNNTIVRNYQNLASINFYPGSHNASPLFAFQVFYHDMRTFYDCLIEEGADLLEIVSSLGKNTLQNQKIRQRYNILPSSTIDQVTQYSIIYLTSQFFQIKEQKKYLDRYLNGIIKDLKRNRQTQAMSLMVHSLEQIYPNDSQIIYVYEKIEDEFAFENIHEEQIVRIETFSPATSKLERVKMEQFLSYFIYQIEHITARDIARYNRQQLGFTHLILPFNEYIVKSKTKKGRNYHVQLRQLPTPKYLNTHLIFWISQNFQEARSFEKKLSEISDLKVEIMLLKDNYMYQVWLKKYYSVTTSRKVCMIYNTPNVGQGLKGINLTHQHLGTDIDILIYINKSEEELQSLLTFPSVKVASTLKTAQDFVISCFQKQTFQNSDNCQSCKCQIY